MGFLGKSVFWLGLVYSAMPFDAPKARLDLTRLESSICAEVGAGQNSAPSAYRAALVTGCAASFAAAPRNPTPVAVPPPARAVTTRGGSAYTLSRADKLPPWLGVASAERKKRRTSS